MAREGSETQSHSAIYFLLTRGGKIRATNPKNQEPAALEAISRKPSSTPVVIAFMNSSSTRGIIFATSDMTGEATDMNAAIEGPAPSLRDGVDGTPFEARPRAKDGLLGTFIAFLMSTLFNS